MKKTEQFKNGVKKIIHELLSIKERFPGFGTIRKDMKRSISPCFDKFAVFIDNETELQRITSISEFFLEETARNHWAKFAINGKVEIVNREEAMNRRQNFRPCAGLFISYTAVDQKGTHFQTVQPIDNFWTVEKAQEEFAKIAVDGKVEVISREKADQLLLQLGEKPAPIETFPDETDSVPTQKDKKLIAYAENLRKDEDKTTRRGPLFLINHNWRKKRHKNFFEMIKG